MNLYHEWTLCTLLVAQSPANSHRDSDRRNWRLQWETYENSPKFESNRIRKPKLSRQWKCFIVCWLLSNSVNVVLENQRQLVWFVSHCTAPWLSASESSETKVTLRVSRVGARPLNAAHYIADSQSPCSAGPSTRPGCCERCTWVEVVIFKIQWVCRDRWVVLPAALGFDFDDEFQGQIPASLHPSTIQSGECPPYLYPKAQSSWRASTFWCRSAEGIRRSRDFSTWDKNWFTHINHVCAAVTIPWLTGGGLCSCHHTLACSWNIPTVPIGVAMNQLALRMTTLYMALSWRV